MGKESEKVKKYIGNIESALAEIHKHIEGIKKKEVLEILELVRDYLEDSKYYLGRKDIFTSLACIAYAEGLLDALKKLGHVKFTWEKERRPVVLVGGVFDIIHPGHLYFLKEAWKLGEVVVVVASDETVVKNKKRKPIFNQDERMKILSSIRYVSKTVKGYPKLNIKKIIEETKPDIIFLGPDQLSFLKLIQEEIKEKSIEIKVLKKKIKDDRYSTSKLIKNIRKNYSE